MAQASTSTQSYDAQIASLEALLSTVDRARSSLPTLLSSFNSPSANASDLAQVYRAASNECWASVRALGHDLAGAEAILSAAEDSSRADAVGIRVQPRESQKATGDDWAKLYEVFASVGSNAVDRKGKGKQRPAVYTRQLADVRTADDLRQVIEAWQAMSQNTGRVTLEIASSSSVREPAEVRLVLKGILHAVFMLYWSERSDGSGRIAQVERVACFGVKERKASYLQSQFSLHNNITKQAMEMIERGRMRMAQGVAEESNVEEVLDFLSDPPLPF